MRIQSNCLVFGAVLATILSLSNIATIMAQSAWPTGAIDCTALKKTDYEAFKAQCVKYNPIAPDLNTLASPGEAASKVPTCVMNFVPAEFPKWSRVQVATQVPHGCAETSP
jgi:hypothetical protein